MQWPESVEIVEVGPRDGLQSIGRVLAGELKVRMIEELVAAGFTRIEVTAFSRPDVVPQHADAEWLVAGLPNAPGVTYRALVPNLRGAERAVACGMGEISVLVTASETYNRLNQNMTIEESLVAMEAIAEHATANGVHVVAAVGLALFCPFEGNIPSERTLGILRRCHEAGVSEAYLATSAGADGPRGVYELCTEVRERLPELRLGVHLHDTNGMALADALAAMQAGVSTFEGSICGLGGGIRLPEGHENYGNVATEDLVNLFTECNVGTGLDLSSVVECARTIAKMLDIPLSSRAATGGTKEDLSKLGRAGRAVEATRRGQRGE